MDELWVVRAGTVPYRRAWAWQRALVERRAADAIPDTVLLLEHPHVYTIGKRGSDADVLADPAWLTANGAEVVRSDRGGQVTYHGLALNCATDLAYFNAIVPCGMPDKAACSLSSLLGRQVPVAEALPVVERRLAERLARTPIPVDPATLDLPAEDYDPETVPC